MPKSPGVFVMFYPFVMVLPTFYMPTFRYGKTGPANKKRQRENQRDSGTVSVSNKPENACIASAHQADPLSELSLLPQHCLVGWQWAPNGDNVTVASLGN